jgi:hypothetical protein
MPVETEQSSTIQTRRQHLLWERCAGALLLALLAVALLSASRGGRLDYSEAGMGGMEPQFVDADAPAQQATRIVEFSPLVTAYAWHAAPTVLGKTSIGGRLPWWLRLTLYRLPFLGAALALGLSIWFVTRKFFSRRAGLLALAFYCTSPAILTLAQQGMPGIVAAWGAYGVIYTAIATAHTLYAPRPGVLWNWKRILMMGGAITLAVGAMPPLVLLLIPAFAFMLWAVPHRRWATLAIVASACGVAALVLSLVNVLLPQGYWAMAAAKGWLAWPGISAAMLLSNLGDLGSVVLEHPLPFAAMLLAVPLVPLSVIALGIYCCWRRPRFFANFSALLIAVLLTLGCFSWRQQGVDNLIFFAAALPFWTTFVVGVEADVREFRKGFFIANLTWLLVGAQCISALILCVIW